MEFTEKTSLRNLFRPLQGTFCARHVGLPIDDMPRAVSVWAGEGTAVVVHGPVDVLLPSDSVAGWFNFTAARRGSKYCVTSEFFPMHEFCNASMNRLTLASNLETEWRVRPANGNAACSHYRLLSLHLDVQDSPTKLLWRRIKEWTILRLGFRNSGGEYEEFSVYPILNSQPWFDLTIQRLLNRDGDGMNYCAEGTLCAHQVDIPIDEVRRVVAVWFGDEYSGSVFGPGLWNSLLGVYGGMWYNYTATQRGSEYCVVPQARPKRETCDETTDSLSIIVSVDTKWDLQPVNLSSGCRRYYLLGLGLPVSDSPTRLLWWPGELADKLILGLGKSSVSSTPFTTFEKIESQPWYDITFQRGPNGYNCVVKSTTLNVSLTCRRDQTQPFFFRSLNHNDTSAPSFFSVNCEDTGIDWRVGVGAAFLLFFFLVIPLVCFWKVRSSNARKMYEDIYMPSPPPSPTLLPSLPSPHFRLPLPPSPPSPPPPPPPAYSVIGGEVGYDYMEVGLLRFQQEMENGDENSLYISYDNRNAAND